MKTAEETPNYEKALSSINEIKKKHPNSNILNQIKKTKSEQIKLEDLWPVVIPSLLYQSNVESDFSKKIIIILLSNNIPGLKKYYRSYRDHIWRLESLLNTAVKRQDIELVKKLLAYGVDPNLGHYMCGGMFRGQAWSPVTDRFLCSHTPTQNLKCIFKELFNNPKSNYSLSELTTSLTKSFVTKDGIKGNPLMIFYNAHRQQIQKDKEEDRNKHGAILTCISFRSTSVNKNMKLTDIVRHAQSANNRSRKVMAELGWINSEGYIINQPSTPEVIRQMVETQPNIKAAKSSVVEK